MSTFVTALSYTIEHLDTAVQDIDLFSERNRHSVHAWNGQLPEARIACIHHEIEAQARKRPSAPAICSWDEEFTYEQFNSLSEMLAGHLVTLGVGPEVLVPVCFEKSAWTYVAIFAVLKAGGAYVPINPQHPKSRLASIVKRAKAPVVLSSVENFELCKALIDDVVLVSATALAKLESPARGKFDISPHNVAYVMFTSGSTGEPKGVVVEHRAFVSASLIHGEAMLYEPETRMLQFAAYSFDTSIDEILTTLLFGGCICVPSESERMNDIAGAINRMQVNYAMLTPSTAALIDPRDVPQLQVLTLVGEAITKGLIETWAPRVKLLNGYGPSECSVITTVNRLDVDTYPSNIGLASGCLCWIVDANKHARLAPVGCVGELVVQGPTLARGYLDDTEKTMASFFENPPWCREDFGTHRFYKTGDMVRYGPGGTISLLGRKDTQIKHHGQRMELGEIEHFFSTRLSVRHAVALVPGSGHCQGRLAVVLSLRDITLSLDDKILCLLTGTGKVLAAAQTAIIRDAMWQELPAYMVPSIWVVVGAMPTLESQKLNRGRVKQWLENVARQTYLDIVNASVDADERVELSATSMETQIREVWSEVLDIPSSQIRYDVPFYSLGGDSITAMQVVARCRTNGMTMSVQDVLRDRTISRLSQSSRFVQHVTIPQEHVTESAFDLSPVQQMYFSMDQQGEHHFNQSFLLSLSLEVLSETLRFALASIVERHPMLRAQFQRAENGHWQQHVSHSSNQDLSKLLCTHSVGNWEELKEKAAIQQASLNIRTGPAFTASLFNLWDGRQLLYLVAHHSVIDLMSWRIIFRDLESFLRSGAPSGRPSSLSFQAWCKMQADFCRQHIRHSESLPFKLPVSNHLSFWGMEGQNNPYGDVIEDRFTIDELTTSALLEESNVALRTETLDILLTAIIHSFHQVFPDRQAPTVFNEGHGREPWTPELDLSETVGWFTTMCPIFVALEQGEDDVLQTLRQVKDTRRRIPGNGWHYFTSSYLQAADQGTCNVGLSMEILFNFLGRYQQLERDGALLHQESERISADVGDHVERPALIEISAVVVYGRLEFTFMLNRHMQPQADLLKWFGECESTLREIIRLLSSVSEPGFTLSDFPLTPFNYNSMGRFLKDILPGRGMTVEDVEDVYPCSPIQEGILLSQSRIGTNYRICSTVEVHCIRPGHFVEPKRFAQAWQRVVDHHAILRTLFLQDVRDDGRPVQLVLRKTTARIVHVTGHGRDEAMGRLQNRPLLRETSDQPSHELVISTTDDSRVYCRFELSHAITDASSTLILLRDIGAAYNNPDQPLHSYSRSSYRDYVAHIQEQAATLHLEYWMAYLRGAEPCLLPISVNHNFGPSKLRSTAVELGDIALLLSILRQRQWSLADLIRSAWALVLRLYTSTNSTCFGYVVSGRDLPLDGIDDIAGPFINLLTCHTNIQANDTLTQLVEKMQTDFLEGITHQATSLAEIQHAFRFSGRHLFNTAISLQRRQNRPPTASNALSFSHIDGVDPTEVRNLRIFNVAIVFLASSRIFLNYLSTCSKFPSSCLPVCLSPSFPQENSRI